MALDESPSVLQKKQDWVNNYHFGLRTVERGTVISIGDGIVWVQGLHSAAIDEILTFEDGSKAMVFHLTEELIGAILLKQTKRLTAGAAVYCSGLRLSVPVGDSLIGRVVDPLAEPLDELGPLLCEALRPVDVLSPPILERDFVNRPLYTGNKILDTLIPLGKGQRQLLIGDNGLGKSSLALDIVINQKGKDVLCVYVLIGQRRSSVVQSIETLKKAGAMEYTVLVVGEASAIAGLQYLAPFSGCTIAEAWMRQGKDSLVVYDDLSVHAACYRQLSLLLRRPPGREAYPADIFYLHSRLLERSTCLSAPQGGGTMTALPIIETEEGEIASYIPTNLISMTDGQVYFDQSLFSGGFLPAIDIRKSVSRIGGKAQDSPIKQEAKRMKLDYLQFLELETFTHLGARLESSMEKQIRRGKILREILKQPRLALLPIETEMAWMVAFNEGFFDELQLDKVSRAIDELSHQVLASNLSLRSDRDEWVKAVKTWLKQI